MRTLLLVTASITLLTACAGAPESHSADIHADHAHVHGDNCGHTRVWHDDHWDYLHDGHLHFVHDGHVDEHVLGVTADNPNGEAPLDASLHADHMHGPGDGHLMVPHGDHMDFVHDGRLHYVHEDHVDDHGPVTIEENS